MITYETSGGAGGKATSFTTASMTISSARPNRLLVVGIANKNNGIDDRPSGVTWQGNALTLMGDMEYYLGQVEVYYYYMLNPVAGTGGVTVTFPSSSYAAVVAASYYNVHKLGIGLENNNVGNPTISIATPCVVTLAGHGLVTGDCISFVTTGALPTGLLPDTDYWAIQINSSTFNVASTYANAIAGTKINTSGTQSGTHTLRFDTGYVPGQAAVTSFSRTITSQQVKGLMIGVGAKRGNEPGWCTGITGGTFRVEFVGGSGASYITIALGELPLGAPASQTFTFESTVSDQSGGYLSEFAEMRVRLVS
jgi:hypothetical protein